MKRMCSRRALYPATMLHHVAPAQKWRKMFIYDPHWGDAEVCRKVVEERQGRQFHGTWGSQISDKLIWLKNAYLSLDFDLDNVLQMELNVKGAL
ncbi:unnamed protein product [Prunus armeniaca]